jgi:hypothetical protein
MKYAMDHNMTNKSDSSFFDVAPLILFGVLLLVGFRHIATWDTYGFEILKLKAKTVASQLNAQDMARLILICRERSQSDCLERYETMKANAEHLAEPYLELAVYFKDKKRADKSMQYYAAYFGATKQKDLAAAYDYAQLLEAAGQDATAMHYYDLAVRHAPKVQPLITRNYVNLLMKNNHLLEAKMWIERVQRNSTESIYFMQTELKSIEQRIANPRMPAAAAIDKHRA